MWLWDRVRSLWERKAPQIGLPHRIDLVPNELSITLDSTEITGESFDTSAGALSVPCWTIFTEGLREFGQEEIILIMRRNGRRSEPEVLDSAGKYFRLIHELAKNKQLVTAGGRTAFQDMSYFGWTNSSGFIYVRPPFLEGVALPRTKSILAIMMIGEELQVAEEFGQQRVLSRLGYQSRYYPFPPWSDPDREQVVSLQEMKDTLLMNLPRVIGRNTHVTKHAGRVIFRLLPSDAANLHEALFRLPQNGVLVILTEMNPHANAILTYLPELKKPLAIFPNGSDCSCMGGCYLALGRVGGTTGAGIHEDGFVVRMGDIEWQNLLTAVELRQPYWLQPEGEAMAFELEWITQDYWDPVEGKVFHAEQGWTTYVPTPRPETGYPDDVRILLLAPEEEVADCDFETLAAYIRSLDEAVRAGLATEMVPEHYPLVIDIQLEAAHPSRIRMANSSGSKDDTLPQIEGWIGEALASLHPPDVKRPLRFQLLYRLRGAAGNPLRVQ